MKNLKMSKISTKSILKKIFKGNSKKKIKKKAAVKKKTTVKKVSKVAKQKTKKIKKVVLKKAAIKIAKAKKVASKKVKKKKITKVAVVKEEHKVNNLRIPKSNEVKPEIKKVKKQETEKREFKIKDYVVYPKHGVGQITEFKKINIGGIDVETYVIKFEKDKANGMVPVNKQSHLRSLATINQVNKCISILKSKPKIKRSMWSRRAQEYEAKISSGKIYELAEVVRDLNKGDDLMVDQSYSERQLFEKAYERILSEFQIVLNVSLEDTQKKLDKALKRNLGGQTQPAATSKTSTTSTTELPVEEPIADSDENLDE
jgi:CarD family transcriptional regulator